MAPNSDHFPPCHLYLRRKLIFVYAGIREGCRSLALRLVIFSLFTWTYSSKAVLLWSDLGATQVHETGPGTDILGGGLQRDQISSTDTLYFKFHVDPTSDASTEYYFSAFQLFEGGHERLAVGNALNAFAYSAFSLGLTGQSNQMVEYIDLNSANPTPSGIGTFLNTRTFTSRYRTNHCLQSSICGGRRGSGDGVVGSGLAPRHHRG